MRYFKAKDNLRWCVLCFGGLFIISSCGAKKKSPPELIAHHELNSTISGQYLGVLKNLNLKSDQFFSGAFTFSKELAEEEFIMDVRLTGGGSNVIHEQYVRIGERCPTLDDDLNQDGFIDAIEGEAVYGKVFIPLDGDVTTQAGHDGEFPLSDQYGNYLYERVANFSEFMKDLRGPLDENYIKLKPEELFTMDGKVVVIHGIEEGVTLPPTVKASSGRTSHQILPIACGLIRKVIEIPGHVETK